MDIVHVFAASNYSFLLAPAPALLLCRVLRKKCILHYQDGRVEEHLRNWSIAVPLVRLASVIVTRSAFVVKVFQHFGIRARAGGISYIVTDGQTGLLVPCDDHAALAAAAIRLLAENGRRECCNYEWSSIRVKWLAVYLELENGLARKAGAAA